MKVVYCGYRGTYGALLTAAIHLGLHEGAGFCDKRHIKKYFEICRLYGEQYGNLIYIGVDEGLREIYILGCKRYFSVIRKAHVHMNRIFKPEENIYHLDVGRLEGILPRIIGFMLARRFSERLCEKLFSYWLIRKYHEFSRMATTIKHKLENGERIGEWELMR
ncbi:MAG: DUF3189 family protein [Clostridiales bacterium]|nr:DUF3189 family protein [Clostridiales bacterium]